MLRFFLFFWGFLIFLVIPISAKAAESEVEIVYSKEKQMVAFLGSPHFKLKSNKKIPNIRVTKDSSQKNASVVIIENPGQYKLTYQSTIKNPSETYKLLKVFIGCSTEHTLSFFFYSYLLPDQIGTSRPISQQFAFRKNDIIQIISDNIVEFVPAEKGGNVLEITFERIGDL